MNDKPKKYEKLLNALKVEEYWNRESEYVQPKIINYSSDEICAERYIESLTSFEIITGGRQIPNRKPKY